MPLCVTYPQSVCVCVCVCVVCSAFLFFVFVFIIILYVNCLGKTAVHVSYLG